jgi:hypothetical protein
VPIEDARRDFRTSEETLIARPPIPRGRVAKVPHIIRMPEIAVSNACSRPPPQRDVRPVRIILQAAVIRHGDQDTVTSPLLHGEADIG